MIFPCNAALAAGRCDGDIPESTVVHVEASLPEDAVGVDIKFIALIEVIVDHRGKKIVCRGYGVDVAGKVKVDILHRNDLRVSAAACAALYSEDGSEGRLSKCQYCLFAEFAQCLRETDAYSCLAFAGRRGVHRGDEDEPGIRVIRDLIQYIERDLGFVLAVTLDVLSRKTQLSCDLLYVFRLCLLSYLDVT